MGQCPRASPFAHRDDRSAEALWSLSPRGDRHPYPPQTSPDRDSPVRSGLPHVRAAAPGRGGAALTSPMKGRKAGRRPSARGLFGLRVFGVHGVRLLRALPPGTGLVGGGTSSSVSAASVVSTVFPGPGPRRPPRGRRPRVPAGPEGPAAPVCRSPRGLRVDGPWRAPFALRPGGSSWRARGYLHADRRNVSAGPAPPAPCARPVPVPGVRVRAAGRRGRRSRRAGRWPLRR